MPGTGKIQELLKSASAGLVAVLKDGELGGTSPAAPTASGASAAGGSAAPPGAADPAATQQGPQATGNNLGGVSPKGVLMDVHQRIAAVMDKLDEAGGADAGLENEVKQLSGLLMAIAPSQVAVTTPPALPAGVPPVPPAAPPPGATAAAPASPTPGASAPLQMRFSAVTKVELDAYTAMTTTMNAISTRIWSVQDMLREGDTDKAGKELRAIAEMVDNAASMVKTAKGVSTMKTYTMNQEQFTKFAADQLAKAATDAPEIATKRVLMLQKAVAIAKESWTGTDPAPPGIKVEIEDAFAPEGDGSAMDLTTKDDQSDKTVKVTSADSGSPGDNSAFENPAKDQKSNAAQGATNNGGTNLPSSNASQDNSFAENMVKSGVKLPELVADLQGVAKLANQQAVIAKRREENPWVPDLNTPAFLEEGDPAKIQKRATESLDWGRDPVWPGK